MQLKYFFVSALVAGGNAQSSSSIAPGLSSTIPASLSKAEKIFLSALPTSAKAFLSSHGAEALLSHFASEEAAGTTPGFLTKLPPKLSSGIQAEIKAEESSLGLASGSGSGSGSVSVSASSSSALLTPAKTTKGGSASSSTSGNYAAKPTAVITAGLVGAMGVIGILAL